MIEFSFGALRRYPDVEAAELVAVDATDRLVLDEAAALLAAAEPGTVAVIGDRHGALTLGAAGLHGARQIRVHTDRLAGERALLANAERLDLTAAFSLHELDECVVDRTRLVLLQLPRSLDALDEIAEVIARRASAEVVVIAGGRLKHMSRAMNEVLAGHLGPVEARLARQKSRVLVAAGPRGTEVAPSRGWPATKEHGDLGLTIAAHGQAFAGTSIDVGTRFLLEVLDREDPVAQDAVDLGCGTGVLAVAVARRLPGAQVIATDESAAAVSSARATALANGVGDRVTVVRDDAAQDLPAASADLVVLNPPFHLDSAVHRGVALKLFTGAARVLRPGGELWTVWNSHLAYRPDLERLVGPTRQVARNAKFTVTVSVRP